MARTSTGESVLRRAFRIIETFTPEVPTLTVSEIARRSQLHVATASRLIAELVDQGLLVREPDRRVRIGVRLWELANRASPVSDLREAAMPFMEDLPSVMGHHTQLGVLDGDEVLFLERLSTADAVINFTRIAGRLPLHASSAGLILLANGSQALQERTLAGPLKVYTRRTISTPARLRSVLADIRRAGFVCCPGHLHPEASGIAVPIRDGNRQVVAALAVIVPNDRHDADRVPALLTAARGIGRQLAVAPRTAGPVG